MGFLNLKNKNLRSISKKKNKMIGKSTGMTMIREKSRHKMSDLRKQNIRRKICEGREMRERRIKRRGGCRAKCEIVDMMTKS